MKVLQLTTHLNIGGITSYLLVLSKAMTQRGHQICVASSGGQKERQFEQRGVSCYSLPVRTKSELDPRLLIALPRLNAILRAEKVDLIHAHTRVTQVLAAMASVRTGIPFVSTAHGFYKNRIGRRLMPCWGEKVIAVGDLVAQELKVAHKVPADRVAVVANALDLEDLERRLAGHDAKKVRAEHGIPENAFVISCISRLVRDKGQHHLVEAMALLLRELPEAYLLLVGDGREKNSLGSMIKRSGLTSQTRLLGGSLDTTVILSMTDVFVHPATYREGFGLSMAEAMLAGVPVVATTIPAIHSLLKSGEDSLLVPPKDPQALSRAILTLARDRSKYRDIALAGQAMAKRVCRPERQAEEIEVIYREVLEKWKKKKS